MASAFEHEQRQLLTVQRLRRGAVSFPAQVRERVDWELSQVEQELDRLLVGALGELERARLCKRVSLVLIGLAARGRGHEDEDGESELVREIAELRRFFHGHEHASDDLEWSLRWLQGMGGEMLILASLLDSDESGGLMLQLWRGFGLLMAALRGVERELDTGALSVLAAEAFDALESFWRGVLAREVALPGLVEAISESLDERALVRELRERLGRGDLSGARACLERSVTREAFSLGLRNFRLLLAPPKVTVGSAGELSSMLDREWLEAHADAYQGQWVALRRGELMGANTSREELESGLEPEARKSVLFLEL